MSEEKDFIKKGNALLQKSDDLLSILKTLRSNAYVGFTEEGYGIKMEWELNGTIGRVVDFPKPVYPERDAEEIWWEDVVIPQLLSDGGGKDYDNLDLDLFDYQNFHPELCGKDIGAGSWVRIKTPTGWEVHFAKKSTKVMDVSPLKRRYKKLEKLELSLEASLEASADDKLKLIEEKLDILKKIAQAEIIEDMDEQPQYVRIQRTRTQSRYLLPKEYEIVKEIELYSDAVVSKECKKGIFFKALFTAQDNDAIHYLRSRGISKETAMMMAKMKHGYFVLNQNELVGNVFTAV